MTSDDRSIGVVFNGAIYNFRDLRAELKAAGYQFKSRTDTEVLIHGYRHWGIDELVARLQGMFAFGLWDDRARKLFLVRDRLGVKPLVYYEDGGQIVFASTVRALRVGGFVHELDEVAVAEYLEFGYVTDDRSIYRGAVKVTAASIVEWSESQLSTRQYWTAPKDSSLKPSFEEAVEETERLFLRAVEMRLHADVSVGALLSGGVDSSLVCWAIAHLGGDVTAYTVSTPSDPLDESAEARATAAHLKIAHRVLELSAADKPDLTERAAAFAEPFASASALGMLRLSQAVVPSAKVLITGDGGDDVFLGYPEHRHLWFAEKLARSLPSVGTRSWLACRQGFPRIGPLRRAASLLDYVAGGLGAVACAHDGLPLYQREGLLGERLADVTLVQRSMPWSLDSGRRVLSEYLEYDRRHRFVGEYMTKVDGATMYFGVEARSPFLDHRLWEFAASLPLGLRLHGGALKAILRELARRKIGERVARGRKRGFSIPVERWIAGRWRGAVEESLRESMLEQEGWIRVDRTLSLLEKSAQRGWAPMQLWHIFVLESWLRYERQEMSQIAEAGRASVTAQRCKEPPMLVDGDALPQPSPL